MHQLTNLYIAMVKRVVLIVVDAVLKKKKKIFVIITKAHDTGAI